MDSTSGSSPEKAFFTNLDTRSVLRVQFNPSELGLTDGAVWHPSEAVEQTHPRLSYQRGESAGLTMELVFDSTDSGTNVHDAYVQPLRDFLSCTVEAGSARSAPMRRPPYCAFTWGTFEFEGVLEKLRAHYLMFASDGTPLRVRVALSLRSALRPSPRAVESGPRDELRTYTTRSGDTLPGIASACGVDARLIVIANGLDDPMDVAPGTCLLLPASPEHAAALGAVRRREAPGNWSDLPGEPEGPW